MMRRTLGVLTVAALAAGGGLAVSAPASAAPALRFHSTQYDSPGKDTRSNTSLNAEWISLVNTGSRAVNLKGWTIRDRFATYTFGNVVIAGKGGRVWLHTGRGVNTARHVYWGRGNYVWNNTGDTAVLRTPTAKTYDVCSWKYKKNRTAVAC